MKKHKFSGSILAASILIVVQYILAFFVYKLPGIRELQWLGWGIWLLSLAFGILPIFILRHKGGVTKGKSYVHTSKLVDTSLYAIVRHPQYLGGILFNISLMLLAQHWIIFGIGLVSMLLIYLEMVVADQEGIAKFGDDYQRYMQIVPRANLALGIYRYIKRRQDEAISDS